jgi:hypothetical protein
VRSTLSHPLAISRRSSLGVSHAALRHRSARRVWSAAGSRCWQRVALMAEASAAIEPVILAIVDGDYDVLHTVANSDTVGYSRMPASADSTVSTAMPVDTMASMCSAKSSGVTSSCSCGLGSTSW